MLSVLGWLILYNVVCKTVTLASGVNFSYSVCMMIVQNIKKPFFFVADPPPGQIAPPDRHVSINGTQQAVE